MVWDGRGRGPFTSEVRGLRVIDRSYAKWGSERGLYNRVQARIAPKVKTIMQMEKAKA